MNTHESTLLRAQTLIESHDYTKARALLMSLLPTELTSDARAQRALLLVHCLHATGAKDLARQTLDAELAVTPASLDLWLLSSHLHAEQNNTKEVEKALQKAMRHCQVPEAGLALASFLTQENRSDEAINCYKRILRHWPKHPDILFEYASLQERMGSHTAAQKTWETLCQSNPTDTEAWLRLAISRSDAGDMEAARKAFDTAKQLEPENLIVWYNRAVAESRSGNLLGVRLCADALQRLSPSSARTHLVSAWATEDRKLSRKHTLNAIDAALAEEVDEDDADLLICTGLSHLQDLKLFDDFDKSFIQALRAEKAGPDTLAIHREHKGAPLPRPQIYRFSLRLPDSFRDQSHPAKFPLRHMDVVAASQEKALHLAHQLETLAGGEKWPLVGSVEVNTAPRDEKEGVTYRSQPCYHDELPT